VSDNKIQKRAPVSVMERGQYFLAFSVVGSMLLVAGFPVLVIFFFGIFAFFLLKMFSSGSRSETREIFEFYLSANEILRDDERRWYGFEINETIRRGEELLKKMNGAPPLVYFTLGALYNKVGDHASAANHLAYVIENEVSDESAYAFPSPELRSYVKVLRKIEREPADAPMTSAAVRALERARKIRGKSLLEQSRAKLEAAKIESAAQLPAESKEKVPNAREAGMVQPVSPQPSVTETGIIDRTEPNGNGRKGSTEREDPFANRKPISEVLHDIYDRNVQ